MKGSIINLRIWFQLWIVPVSGPGEGCPFDYSPQFLSRVRRKKTERLLSQQALRLRYEEYSLHLSSSPNRMSITAAWALVAWPWGLRVEPSPVPVIMPAPQAHWRAEMAYSDTWKVSV